MHNLFKKSKETISEHLEELTKKVNETEIVATEAFYLDPIKLYDNNFINELIRKITLLEKSSDSKMHIYKFSLENHSSNDYDKIELALQTFKENNNLFNTSRILKTHNCQSLYVGSSSTSLKTRLKYHFGYGSKTTYSLHLKEWFPDINNRIKLEIIKLSQNANREVLQSYEDFIWEESQPLFGKKGGT